MRLAKRAGLILVCLSIVWVSVKDRACFSENEKEDSANLVFNPGFEKGEFEKKKGGEWKLAGGWIACDAREFMRLEFFDPDAFMKPVSLICLDVETVKSGKRSFRLQTTKGNMKNGLHTGIRSGRVPVAPGKKYTLSIWAKGDRHGLQISLIMGDSNKHIPQEKWSMVKTYVTERDWKRYSLTATIPGPGENGYAPERDSTLIYINVLNEGTVWFDDASFVQED